MIIQPWAKWLVMLTLSIAVHAIVVASYFVVADVTVSGGSAIDEGESGIEVGLGQQGSYVDMTNQLLAADAPKKEQTKREVKPIEPVKTKKVVEPKPKPKLVPKKTEPEPQAKLKIKPKVTKPVVSNKPEAIVKQGDYSLAKENPAVKVEPLIESETAKPDLTTPETETKELAQKNKQSSKASIKATGSASNESSGGFKGSNRNYFSHLSAWLNKYKGYPIEAKRLKQEGVVHVQFTIGPTGKVLATSIKKSSGYSLLDKDALNVLTLADPLPAPPERLKRDRLTLVIPIDFSLITNN